jgi:hypothetical protein
MGRSAAEQARLESVVFAALEYFASKRYRRDQLSVGETRVQGVISATVGRAIVEVPFSGDLRVAEDQDSASSSAPDTDHVVGYLLEQLDEPQRKSLLAKLPKEFEQTKELPVVPESRIAEAKDLLKRLRSIKIKAKKGSVVFAVQNDEPAE